MKQIVMAFRIVAILGLISYLLYFNWATVPDHTVKTFLIWLTLFSIIIAIVLQLGSNLFSIIKKDR